MKMEKTEMEFVAFDAQDVIATSGGPTVYNYLYSSCETISPYNGDDYSVDSLKFVANYAITGGSKHPWGYFNFNCDYAPDDTDTEKFVGIEINDGDTLREDFNTVTKILAWLEGAEIIERVPVRKALQ